MVGKMVRHPIFQAVFVLLLLTVIYFIVGKEGSVQAVALTDHNAYVSMGDYGQVAIYQIRKSPRPIMQPVVNSLVAEAFRLPYRIYIPMVYAANPLHQKIALLGDIREEKQELATPVYLGTFSFGGRASGLAVKGNILYIASPLTGLHVVNALDPQRLEQLDYFELVGANSVSVAGNYAFVTAGKAGLYVFDISSPNHIRLVGHSKSFDSAQGVYFLDQTSTRALPERWQRNIEEMNASSKTIQGRLYMADGKAGVQIFDVSDLAHLQFVNLIQVADARQVDFTNYLLYVAGGHDGLCVLDVFDELNPVKMTCLPLKADAIGVTIWGNNAYVSVGKGGMVVAGNVNTPRQLSVLATFPALDSVNDIKIQADQAFVGDGQFGLRVVDVSNTQKMIVRGYQETPGEASPAQLLQSIVNPAYRTPKTGQTWLVLASRFGLMLLVALSGLLLLGQFVLPVSTWQERLLTISYQVFFFLNRHGRMVYIENGRVISALEDINPPKLRVAWLDQASMALILRPDGSLRTAEPGLIFLSEQEKIAVSLDLHLRTFIYGPELGEAPTADQRHSESQDVYAARQRRREETTGLTRDGLEVVPNLVIDFKVKGEPGEGNNPYGFDAKAATQAMKGELPFRDGQYQIDDLHSVISTARRWEAVPGQVAAEAWREVLLDYDLKELFEEVEPRTAENLHLPATTYLDVIIQRVNDLLIKENNPKVDRKGNPVKLAAGSPATTTSRFVSQLLEYGIQVLSVSIVNLHFHTEDEKELVEIWQEHWLARCRKEQILIRRIRDVEAQKACEQASLDYSKAVFKPLVRRMHSYGNQVNSRLTLNEALDLLLRGTRELPELDSDCQVVIDRLSQWAKDHPI